MEKTIKELEEELEMMKNHHKSMWQTYGSKLSTGNMIDEEKELELKILKLKTIERWKKKGLLEDLTNKF